MIKALIIGCGNIGGQYDLKNDFVLTHAKGMFLSDWIDKVDVFDLNVEASKQISEKYDFLVLKEYNKKQLKNYQVVSICTPTETHFGFLKDCISVKIPLVICEKPVSYSNLELNQILNLYNAGSTKVLVNYYRRFQKKYFELKNELILNKSELINVDLKYFKGILNYASHGLDIINYLLDFNFNYKVVKINSQKFDFFKQDPTVSVLLQDKGVNFSLLSNDIDDPILEINLYFRDYKLEITDLGNSATFVYPNSYKRFDFLITNYMSDVFSHVKEIFFEKEGKDNFIESLNLNNQLLKVI